MQEQGHAGAQVLVAIPGGAPPVTEWWNVTRGLYDVVKDPREMNDLQALMPQQVAALKARLLFWLPTTVTSIHNRTRDPGAPLKVLTIFALTLH